MHLGSFLADSDVGLPSVIWLKEEEFLYNGLHFKLQALRDMVKVKVESTTEVFARRVMKNIPLDTFIPKSEVIMDELRNTRTGYNFISDSRNPFAKAGEEFMRRVMADPQWGPVLGDQEEGKFVWKAKAASEWMDEIQKFKESLFFLVHITSGLPSRGTEASVTLIRNTPTARRNLYAIGNRVCLIGTYNKTSHNSHRDRLLPRGLEEQVGRLLLVYLALVRPLETAMAHELVDQKHWHLYETHLWVGSNGCWDTSTFNKILQANFMRHLKVEVTVGSWRHIATAIMRRHLVKQLEKQPDIQQELLESMGDEQAGHTGSISNLNYAVEVHGLDQMPERKLKLFILVSAFETSKGLS